eukprot:g16934.t1
MHVLAFQIRSLLLAPGAALLLPARCSAACTTLMMILELEGGDDLAVPGRPSARVSVSTENSWICFDEIEPTFLVYKPHLLLQLHCRSKGRVDVVRAEERLTE